MLSVRRRHHGGRNIECNARHGNAVLAVTVHGCGGGLVTDTPAGLCGVDCLSRGSSPHLMRTTPLGSPRSALLKILLLFSYFRNSLLCKDWQAKASVGTFPVSLLYSDRHANHWNVLQRANNTTTYI